VFDSLGKFPVDKGESRACGDLLALGGQLAGRTGDRAGRFQRGKPFRQGRVFRPCLGRHCLDRIEFLTRDQVLTTENSGETPAQDFLRLTAGTGGNTERPGGDTGEIIEKAVACLHGSAIMEGARRRLKGRGSVSGDAMPPVLALPFPAIDPVLVSIGPFVIRWYALAYIAGLLIGWWLVSRKADAPPVPGMPWALNRARVDDFLLWATLGVILGGRIGYVVFYQPAYYFAHPLDILAVWQGGMSFHGGLAGVITAIVLFCRAKGIAIFALGDLIALAAPIGLFFGRIANFINGELFGRASDVPWAMVFPRGGPEPRHPSQLYEAALEGLVLFVLLALLARFAHARARPGLLTGAFFAGYGCARVIVEFFREPDVQIGYLAFGTTMGQWLSLPLIAIGLWLIVRARRGTAQA
jgi:phosphatidylglycerol:prolipoprotein diacylglycerol transferase